MLFFKTVSGLRPFPPSAKAGKITASYVERRRTKREKHGLLKYTQSTVQDYL